MSDQIIIYHNPRCSKSRAALNLLRNHGVEPEIVEYLKTPPDIKQLKKILLMLKKNPRDIIRKGEKEYKSLKLDNQSLDNDSLIKHMVENPILIERPIVISERGAVIGRPPENVLALIEEK